MDCDRRHPCSSAQETVQDLTAQAGVMSGGRARSTRQCCKKDTMSSLTKCQTRVSAGSVKKWCRYVEVLGISAYNEMSPASASAPGGVDAFGKQHCRATTCLRRGAHCTASGQRYHSRVEASLRGPMPWRARGGSGNEHVGSNGQHR